MNEKLDSLFPLKEYLGMGRELKASALEKETGLLGLKISLELKKMLELAVMSNMAPINSLCGKQMLLKMSLLVCSSYLLMLQT